MLQSLIAYLVICCIVHNVHISKYSSALLLILDKYLHPIPFIWLLPRYKLVKLVQFPLNMIHMVLGVN